MHVNRKKSSAFGVSAALLMPIPPSADMPIPPSVDPAGPDGGDCPFWQSLASNESRDPVAGLPVSVPAHRAVPTIVVATTHSPSALRRMSSRLLFRHREQLEVDLQHTFRRPLE